MLAALRGHAGCVATLLGHGCDPRRVSLDPIGNAYGVADGARRKKGREGAAPPHAYNEVLQLLLVSDSGIRDASEQQRQNVDEPASASNSCRSHAKHHILALPMRNVGGSSILMVLPGCKT